MLGVSVVCIGCINGPTMEHTNLAVETSLLDKLSWR